MIWLASACRMAIQLGEVKPVLNTSSASPCCQPVSRPEAACSSRLAEGPEQSLEASHHCRRFQGRCLHISQASERTCALLAPSISPC